MHSNDDDPRDTSDPTETYEHAFRSSGDLATHLHTRGVGVTSPKDLLKRWFWTDDPGDPS